MDRSEAASGYLTAHGIFADWQNNKLWLVVGAAIHRACLALAKLARGAGG